jgi:hypothetical protein
MGAIEAKCEKIADYLTRKKSKRPTALSALAWKRYGTDDHPEK